MLLNQIDLNEAREIFLAMLPAYANIIQPNERITKFDFLARLKEQCECNSCTEKHQTFYDATDAFPFVAMQKVNKSLHIFYS